MDDTKITASPTILEISGKEFAASPLTDRDLGHLTNYVRYQINKRAREESSFAETSEEADEIQKAAFEVANALVWYEPTALRILSTPAGTAKVAYLMLRKEDKGIQEEWLQQQFGSESTMLEEHILNTVAVRQVFGELNALKTEVSEPTEVKKVKKKKSP